MVTLRLALRLMRMRAQTLGRHVVASLLLVLGIRGASGAQVRSAPRLDMLTLHSSIFGNTRTREMVDDVYRLAGLIGHNSDTCVVIVPGAEHDEDAWRSRLPAALGFLFGIRRLPKTSMSDMAIYQPRSFSDCY